MTRSARLATLAGAALALPLTTFAADGDPAHTDGDKYAIVVDNADVRVLRYHDEPGEKTHPHHHPRFVMIALSSFRRRLTFADGTKKERDFAAGDVVFMPEQSHTGENVGKTATDVVLVELKGAAR